MKNVAVVGNNPDRFDYFLSQVHPTNRKAFRFILVKDEARAIEVGKTLSLVTMISAKATHKDAEDVMLRLRLYVIPYIEAFDFTKENPESLQAHL